MFKSSGLSPDEPGHFLPDETLMTVARLPFAGTVFLFGERRAFPGFALPPA